MAPWHQRGAVYDATSDCGHRSRQELISVVGLDDGGVATRESAIWPYGSERKAALSRRPQHTGQSGACCVKTDGLDVAANHRQPERSFSGRRTAGGWRDPIALVE